MKHSATRLSALPRALARNLTRRLRGGARREETAEARVIPIRDRRFAWESIASRYWHGGGPAVSIFFDNLSVFFPPGERFFMQSVKAFRDHAPEDSPLADEVRAFFAQEAYHGREHRAYNARLQALGYPAEAMEARVARLLKVVQRVIPPRMQLAATCALEHYTAFMGHALLGDPRILEGSEPELAALWRWHAVEENEHKAVAHDLFVAAGGSWLERVLAMGLATVIFWAKVGEQQVRMMRAAGLAGSPSAWAGLARFLFVTPGNLRYLPLALLDYLRPGFHPDDTDAEALIAAWREADAAQSRETGS